jgi:riboflavin biosynthesis pyrimidine reductase
MSQENHLLFEHYARKSGVRLVMAANGNLETSGQTGSSSDVSNELDRALLVHLRKLSDLAITDVATAQAESYKPSKLVQIEIWSKSGDFRGLGDLRGDHKNFDVLKVDDLKSRMRELRGKHESILVEAGATLSRKLADEREIDSAAITITGASNELGALAALEQLKSHLGLGYLKALETTWMQGSLFARLSA